MPLRWRISPMSAKMALKRLGEAPASDLPRPAYDQRFSSPFIFPSNQFVINKTFHDHSPFTKLHHYTIRFKNTRFFLKGHFKNTRFF